MLSFVTAACGTSADSDVPAADGSGVPAATTAGTVAAEPAEHRHRLQPEPSRGADGHRRSAR